MLLTITTTTVVVVVVVVWNELTQILPVLNLLDITSKVCTIAMFVIPYLLILFCTEFVDMSIIYLHTRFHLPISNDLLLIAIKPKAKCSFYAAAILFYILEKNYY